MWRVNQLTPEQICVGLRIISVADGGLGTVISKCAPKDGETICWVLWDGKISPDTKMIIGRDGKCWCSNEVVGWLR